VQVEGRLLVGRFDGQHGVHADLGQHVGNLEIIKPIILKDWKLLFRMKYYFMVETI
jgi:hypothetical protein